MSDPYNVLGVSPNATDDEIKSAYREMAKKYHPDNYAQSPLSDLAAEKMKEINEAYDAIVAERKNRKHGGNTSYSYGGYDGGAPYSGNYARSTNYNDVRNLVMNGRVADAEQILNGVPTGTRDAEWYFLKGTVLYKKGWLEEAYTNFSTACNMAPGNAEYRAAMNQVQSQRNGVYGGYNTSAPMAGGCNACDMCSSLVCADCCCECMGGDLISCC